MIELWSGEKLFFILKMLLFNVSRRINYCCLFGHRKTNMVFTTSQESTLKVVQGLLIHIMNITAMLRLLFKRLFTLEVKTIVLLL
jgi:hypothetical protein